MGYLEDRFLNQNENRQSSYCNIAKQNVLPNCRNDYISHAARCEYKLRCIAQGPRCVQQGIQEEKEKKYFCDAGHEYIVPCSGNCLTKNPVYCPHRTARIMGNYSVCSDCISQSRIELASRYNHRSY